MSEQDRASLEVQKEQDPGATAAVSVPSTPGRTPRLAIVLSLLTLVIVVVSLYFGYRYWSGMQRSLMQLNASIAQAGREQSSMREGLTATRQALEQQRQQIQAQEKALSEQRHQLEQERDAMRQQGAQLNRSLSNMQQRLGIDTQQWQVAEAEYLIRVANHRLSLMHDPATALRALAAADERLRDTGDPGWGEVRKVLARDMASLQALPKVDKAGLNASLTTLAKQVDQLTLADEGVMLKPEQRDAGTREAPQASSGFDFRRLLQDLWNGFKSMMVIRHHEQSITAMLTPEQGDLLRQNLRLKLEGASYALLARNAAFYRESLTSSATWLKRYFAVAAPQVQAFDQQLAELAQQDIAPQLPDISDSLRALQKRRSELNREESE